MKTVLLLSASIFALAACGGGGGSSNPGGKGGKTAPQTELLNGITSYEFNDLSTELTLQLENGETVVLTKALTLNGSDVWSATDSQSVVQYSIASTQTEHSTIGIYRDATIANTTTFYSFLFSDLTIDESLAGSGQVVYTGHYSQTSADQTFPTNGDATIFVDFTAGTMTVEGPSAIEGLTLNWDTETNQFSFDDGVNIMIDAFTLGGGQEVVGGYELDLNGDLGNGAVGVFAGVQ